MGGYIRETLFFRKCCSFILQFSQMKKKVQMKMHRKSNVSESRKTKTNSVKISSN